MTRTLSPSLPPLGSSRSRWVRARLFATLALLAPLVCGACGDGDAERLDSSSAAAARIVVDYEFGNSLARSSVRILDNGVVLRTESTCCPSRTEPVLVPPLGESTRAELLAGIDEIARLFPEKAGERGDSIPRRASGDIAPDPAARSGSLVVVDRSGRPITLWERGGSEARSTRSVSVSAPSRAIIAVVNELAFQKIPVARAAD